MKYIVIIGDGMADYKIQELNFKTPLEVAHKENIDFLARNGKCGLIETIPKNFDSGSDVANLSILGYDVKKFYTGRAPIEAASKGIILDENQIAFRVNLITEKDNKIYDYSAGHIGNEEAKILINLLNKKLSKEIKELKGKFYPGVSYRNLFVCVNRFGNLISKPPHDVVGKKISENLIKGENSEILNNIMLKSKEILEDSEINKKRKREGKNVANMIWFWGQGKKPKLENFEKKYKLKGAVISAVDLIKGIGKLIGMDVIEVEGATGLWDTNYNGKAIACVNALKSHDFVYLHVEATDEASHIGNLDLKIKSIENLDKMIGKILQLLNENNIDARIAILPDHFTVLKLGTHTSDPVPCVIYDTKNKDDNKKDNNKNNKVNKFSENECKNCGIVKIGKFMELLLK